MQQTYIGTKAVKAEPMTRADWCKFRGWPVPENENPLDEGYLVEYLDGGKPNVTGRNGYVSWSPKDVFEASYRRTSGLPFGLAVEALKMGMAIARDGWNGKDMFVYLVPGNSFPAQTGVAKAYFGTDGLVPYNRYMVLKGADETVSTWAPSGSDTLADDWIVVHPGLAKIMPAGDGWMRAANPAPQTRLQPHQQRVVDEKCELDARLAKLTPFFDTPIFAGLAEEEKQRLERQEEAMKAYSAILADRIAAFMAAASTTV